MVTEWGLISGGENYFQYISFAIEMNWYVDIPHTYWSWYTRLIYVYIPYPDVYIIYLHIFIHVGLIRLIYHILIYVYTLDPMGLGSWVCFSVNKKMTICCCSLLICWFLDVWMLFFNIACGDGDTCRISTITSWEISIFRTPKWNLTDKWWSLTCCLYIYIYMFFLHIIQ